MAQCPKCGGELAAERLECPSCGAEAALWIGRAGRTYGPYTLSDLRQAQAQGRLGPGDLLMIGSEGQWRPLAEVMGQEVLKAPPPPMPSVHEGAGTVSGLRPPTHSAPPAAPVKRQETPVGLIVGLVLLIMVVPIMILAAILFPVFAKAREKARQASCMANVKQINLGLLMYCQDWDERFPPKHQAGMTGGLLPPPPGAQTAYGSAISPYPPGDWRSDIYPYIRNSEILLCPSSRAPDSYQFNEEMHGVWLGKIVEPQRTLSVYEKGWRDGSSPPPHNGGYNVGFVDGHCKWEVGTE
jgi:prepilin-type processing-associated H-X9-DG protein